MFLVSNIVWDSASADSQIALFRSPAHIPISKYLCPGSDLILSKKTGGTEVSLQGLETFTSYYVKIAAFTKVIVKFFTLVIILVKAFEWIKIKSKLDCDPEPDIAQSN